MMISSVASSNEELKDTGEHGPASMVFGHVWQEDVAYSFALAFCPDQWMVLCRLVSAKLQSSKSTIRMLSRSSISV